MTRLLEYPTPLFTGTLVRRYKRFFVDVLLDDGQTVVAHTANTGAMTGMQTPGFRVLVSHHDDVKRKLKYTLQAVFDGKSWIGANPIFSNRIAKEIVSHGHLDALAGYDEVQPEVKVTHGDESSRLDFLLRGHKERSEAYVEVKSATLRRDQTVLFPDAVTVRGKRHVEVLRGLVGRGFRGVLLLLVQRGDCERFVPAWDVDPGYCTTLVEAAAAGVEVIAQEIVVSAGGVFLGRVLPADLSPAQTTEAS